MLLSLGFARNRFDSIYAWTRCRFFAAYFFEPNASVTPPYPFLPFSPSTGLSHCAVIVSRAKVMKNPSRSNQFTYPRRMSWKREAGNGRSVRDLARLYYSGGSSRWAAVVNSAVVGLLVFQ